MDWKVRYKGESRDLSNFPHKVVHIAKNGETGKAIIQHKHVCPRCRGVGGSDQWRHTGWTCYQCGGRGTWVSDEVVNIYSSERAQRLEKAAARSKARKMEKRQALKAKVEASFEASRADAEQIMAKHRAAFAAENPGLLEHLEAFKAQSVCIQRFVDYIQLYGTLDEDQVDKAWSVIRHLEKN